jgi:hypothetical protein
VARREFDGASTTPVETLAISSDEIDAATELIGHVHRSRPKDDVPARINGKNFL